MSLALATIIAVTAPSAMPAQIYAEAVAARQAGDPQRAIELLEPLVASQPDNGDARLQLALAYLAQQRLDDAESGFRQVLAASPAYDDARIGLVWVAQRRGDAVTARRELGLVRDQQRPEVTALRRQLAEESRRWRLDVDGSYSFVDQRSDWKEGAVHLRYQLDQRTAITGGIEYAQRFGNNDVLGDIQIDHRFSDSIAGFVAVGATPGADFLPDWRIALGGSARVIGGKNPTVLVFEARQAHYAAGDIQTVNPGIEQYFAGGKFWLTARAINIFDENGKHHLGYTLRGDVLAGERVRIFGGIADAPDTSEGVVVDTFGVFGGVNVQVTERYALRVSLAHEDRASGPDRTQIGLGASIAF